MKIGLEARATLLDDIPFRGRSHANGRFHFVERCAESKVRAKVCSTHTHTHFEPYTEIVSNVRTGGCVPLSLPQGVERRWGIRRQRSLRLKAKFELSEVSCPWRFTQNSTFFHITAGI